VSVLEIPELVAEREQRLRDLGQRPPWYRLFARRRWKAERARISTMDVSVFAWMLRQMYTPDMVTQMAARPSLVFTSLAKVNPNGDNRTGSWVQPVEYSKRGMTVAECIQLIADHKADKS